MRIVELYLPPTNDIASNAVAVNVNRCQCEDISTSLVCNEKQTQSRYDHSHKNSHQITRPRILVINKSLCSFKCHNVGKPPVDSRKSLTEKRSGRKRLPYCIAACTAITVLLLRQAPGTGENYYVWLASGSWCNHLCNNYDGASYLQMTATLVSATAEARQNLRDSFNALRERMRANRELWRFVIMYNHSFKSTLN